MTATTLLKPLTLFFRFGSDPEETTPATENVDDDAYAGIRCPYCKWRPTRDSVWTCWDCDHPEYFYNGCGTDWNTFDTRGVCPTCRHQWQWTSCHACYLWSRHEDWYEES